MIEQAPPSTAQEKDKALSDALKIIEKEHGKGAVLKMGSKHIIKLPAIPTGIHSLDYRVLGIGGIPKGRIVEIFGPESSGKTTLLLRAIAEVQKRGGRSAIIDAEHAFDPVWAALNGVIVDELFISQPDCGEQAMQIAEVLIASGAFDIIGVDSVAALVPRAELDGDIGDSNVGLQARLMSQTTRKLTGIVSKSGTCLVFINQIREKIGVMFGSPETTTGGRALKFFSSVRLDIRRIGSIKVGDAIIGNNVRIKAVKNKCAAPFRETEVALLFDRGFDLMGDLFDAGVVSGVIDKSGAWYAYKGEKLGQGKTNAITALETAKLVDELRNEILQKEALNAQPKQDAI